MSARQQANVDTASNFNLGGAFGRGMEYFTANAEERQRIVANADTLEKDEWETISDTVVQVYQDRRVGLADLENAGLVRNISLATIFDTWQDVSAMTEAEVSMDGEAVSERDRVTYGENSAYIPIVHKDFTVSERELMSSRALNNDLRTDGVAAATEQVLIKAEQILFQGLNPDARDDDGDTASVDGYTTHPDRNTVSGSDWGTPGNIRDDIVSMLNDLDDDNRTPGQTGFWLYIAPPQWQQFRSSIDPDGDGNLTVRERVLDEFDAELGAVRRAEFLPDGEAVMVDPSPDVVELAVAEDVQTVEWDSGSGMTNYFKVLWSGAPEIKSDSGGRSGISHATGI